jgi:DNA-binding IclR family transcriptional regulator
MALGVRGIAAPGFALPGQAIAAVGVAGPAARRARAAVLKLERSLNAAGGACRRGYRGSSGEPDRGRRSLASPTAPRSQPRNLSRQLSR